MIHVPGVPGTPLLAGTAVVSITLALTLTAWLQAGVLAPGKLVFAKISASGALAAAALYNYAFAKKKA